MSEKGKNKSISFISVKEKHYIFFPGITNCFWHFRSKSVNYDTNLYLQIEITAFAADCQKFI